MSLRKRIVAAALLAATAVGGNALHASVSAPVNDGSGPWACFVTAGAPCGCQPYKCLVNCYCGG